ncbi:MAG: flavodoxin-dependent (E)-4-hydroxy-3-methylbut-2-enyl-diphosphate synthase [Thermoguttaceae bacterium]
MIKRRITRAIKVGSVMIGGENPVVIQSMAATKTVDVGATAKTCQYLADSGAGLVRVAVDTANDAAALKEISERTTANLSVDLQENYRLAEVVAPFVDKIRYNPGHLHHVEPEKTWQEKVQQIVCIAEKYDCALRIGVNCGSLDPHQKGESPMLQSAIEHADFIDSLGFTQFCVSLKSSDPHTVIAVNRRFAELRPEIPLHLGVTEAGLPPDGILKSRLALEPLLAEGIGETLRVSLTVQNDRKIEEIEAGKLILDNVTNGTVLTETEWHRTPLEIISCPSCARVENDRFVTLAEEIRDATRAICHLPLKIAVMGCRVNGPGETDNADWGVWCGPHCVNLKRGSESVGSFSYESIIPHLICEIKKHANSSSEYTQHRE